MRDGHGGRERLQQKRIRGRVEPDESAEEEKEKDKNEAR